MSKFYAGPNYPGGDDIFWELDDDQEPRTDWRKLTKPAYDKAVAAQAAADQAASDAAVLTACAERKAIYDNLKASVHTSDWAEATIVALSGYTPGDC